VSDVNLDGYVDVATRLAEFRDKYPDGSLQPLNLAEPFKVQVITGTDKAGKDVSDTFIVYTAAAYRQPADPRPGIGCAYEVYPGRTPYTRGSELQNAETSAWGRAIIACLAADSRAGVASAEEVRNRQAEQNGHAQPVNATDVDWFDQMVTQCALFATVDEGRGLWRRISEKAACGGCTADDAAMLKATVQARSQELQEPSPNGNGHNGNGAMT
jgi:hypothetical protein